jgi:transcriptional regulator with XRE-family HTH domain
MASIESPAGARRRLRLALRALRDERGLTQAQVAEALDWSLSKVIRIERGDVTISRTDLKAALSFYKVEDSTVVAELLDEARASRQRGWWAEPRFRDHLTPAMLQLLQFEGEAKVIRSFQPTIFPGYLQTESYATPIVNFFQDLLPEQTRAVRLELRTLRHAHIFDRPNPPQYLLVIDESVILRQIGGPQVLAEQLQRFLEEIENGRLRCRVLPHADPALAALLGPFRLLDLGDDNDDSNAVLYREAQARDEILQDPDEVARHRRIFEQMWENALHDDESERLIRARLATLLTSLDLSARLARR